MIGKYQKLKVFQLVELKKYLDIPMCVKIASGQRMILNCLILTYHTLKLQSLLIEPGKKFLTNDG